MAAKKKKAKARAGWRSWSLPSLSDSQRRFIRRVVLRSVLLLVIVAGIAVGTVELDARVRQDLLTGGTPSLVFVDLPPSLAPLVEPDLRAAVADLVEGDWLEADLCRDMALSLNATGWLSDIRYVRRGGNARFEVSARYRFPVAMVQHGNEFLLVDRDAVRLPGVYTFDPQWKVIQGVDDTVPTPGQPWGDPGLKAGVRLVTALAREPFDDQITGVLVGNYGGRVNRSRSHIELATDRAGGRIRWGSAPGEELAENTFEQKLAILRENFRVTGRVDAHHPVIDISTFPDRFIVPQ